MKALISTLSFVCLLVISSLSIQAQMDIALTENAATIAHLEAKIGAALEPVHCEVPCGIYGDSLRIDLINEHIATIEKGMNQITELSGAGSPNYNQLIRWVSNKEHHAEEIQEIVSQYFLHQRIKLTDPNDKTKYDKYVAQLTYLHEMLVHSMKCKQTTDLENVNKLKAATANFSKSYFGGHKHDHKHPKGTLKNHKH